jgi:RNA-binding protein YhbY
MHLYTTVQVSGNVFVYYGSSKRNVFYTTVQVSGNVFVYYGSSER